MSLQVAHRLQSIEHTILRSQESETLTLLDLVAAVADASSTEQEVVSTVTRLINTGKVTLVGNFRGADVRVG